MHIVANVKFEWQCSFISNGRRKTPVTYRLAIIFYPSFNVNTLIHWMRALSF